MTNLEALTSALEAANAGEVLTDETAIAKIAHMVEQNAKRNKSKTLNSKQKANLAIKDNILACVRSKDFVNMSDIRACDPHITSSQHATSLVSQLIAAGYVERIKDKEGTTYKAI